MRLNHRPITKPRSRSTRRRAGFTLIEASLTMVIVSTGVLAIVSAQQAYHIKNDYAVRAATGQLLANEIREMTFGLPQHDPITGAANFGPEPGEASVADYDDLDDFAGVVDAAGVGAGLTLNPPVNAVGVTLPNMGRWTQQISVGNVFPNFIDTVNTEPLGTTDMVRMTVQVFYQEDTGAADRIEVARMIWVVPTNSP